MIWFPDAIYERLPLIYIVLAIFGIVSPENYGRFCGVLLILAAYHIIRIRRKARTNVVNEK
jgi:hypothetical protein